MVATPQAVLPSELDRHVRVALAGEVIVDADEPVTLVAQVEVTLDVHRFEADRGLLVELLAVLALRARVLPAAVLAAPAPALVAALAVVGALTAAALLAAIGLRTRLTAGLTVAPAVAGTVDGAGCSALVGGGVVVGLGIELPLRLRLLERISGSRGRLVRGRGLRGNRCRLAGFG